MAKQTPTTVTPEIEVDVAAEVVIAPREPDGNTSNALEVVWPQDEFGFTSMLRKEGVRAVGRIRGDDTKMKVFLATLQVLAEHAMVKIVDQQATIKADIEEVIKRDEAVYARNEADKAAEVARLEALLTHAKAELKAKIAVME